MNNIRNIKYIVANDYDNKINLLLNYANINRSIKDPWYTGNFDETYEDIMLGIEKFYQYLLEKHKCLL